MNSLESVLPYLFVIIVLLILIACILLYKLYLLRKSADEIAAQISEKVSGESNVLIDISSRDRHMRRLAATINEQLALLRSERHRFQQGDSELKEAVTNISHDLRTPLTAICGYLDLLAREEQSEETARYISMIENRTEVLKQLTEELFRYSVIMSVNDESNEQLALGDVLEESLLSFYGAMQQQNITPVITIPEKRIIRRLNRSSLSRIFGNIISNALKYSDGDLDVALYEDGSISFTNTAKELTAVDIGKLFDRFFTVETGRNSTGLGLSIARLLTERMGGNIRAVFEDGRLTIRLRF